jgi:hypothetical protein
MKATALGVRFALELCILASFAILAAHLSVSILAQILLAIVFCVVGAAVWGAFLSPRRHYELGTAARLVLEAVFFLGAVGILFYVGYSALGIALLVVAIVDKMALALMP